MLDQLTVLDFETTGFDPRVGYVTEIGAVRLRGGEVRGQYSDLVALGGTVPANITALTGITTEMCASGCEAVHAFRLLRNFIGSDTVVCHNAAFDISWLATSYQRYGGQPLASDFLCTVALAQHYWPDMVSQGTNANGRPLGPYQLENLCLYFGIKTGSHRALGDAHATAILTRLLLEAATVEPGSWLAAEPLLVEQFLNRVCQPYHGRGSRAPYEVWLPAYARRVGEGGQQG